LLLPPEVYLSCRFFQGRENLFKREADFDKTKKIDRRRKIPPMPKTDNFIARNQVCLFRNPQKVLTLVKDMSDSDSVETDYTPFISTPLSSHDDTIYYSEHIEPYLLASLEPLELAFFFTLTILNIPTTDRSLLTSPLIIIFTPTKENLEIIHAKVKDLWAQPRFYRFIVSVSLGTYMDSSRLECPPSYATKLTRAYHSHWKCGISIGYGKKTVTSGIILENVEQQYTAITCAHLFTSQQDDPVGLKVTQPSFEDFCDLYKASVNHLNECEISVQRARSDASRTELERRVKDAQELVDRLDEIRHDTPEHYQTDTETAPVIKSSYRVVDYRGRRCFQDYALLRLDHRMPNELEKFHDPTPTDGHLSGITWASEANSVGRLRYDIHVKKRGAATGVTWGIIAGVYGVLKSEGDEKARKEYWALPEKLSTTMYEFGAPGDSGSLVWSDKGEAVGIIIAGWCPMFDNPALHAVILPNRYWDTKNIPFPRDGEGNIDFNGLMSFVVYRPLCLIESLEMVLEDVGGDYQLYVPL
jgi:hypothetical protein